MKLLRKECKAVLHSNAAGQTLCEDTGAQSSEVSDLSTVTARGDRLIKLLALDSVPERYPSQLRMFGKN